MATYGHMNTKYLVRIKNAASGNQIKFMREKSRFLLPKIKITGFRKAMLDNPETENEKPPRLPSKCVMSARLHNFENNFYIIISIKYYKQNI
jgi:hypothetical protein